MDRAHRTRQVESTSPVIMRQTFHPEEDVPPDVRCDQKCFQQSCSSSLSSNNFHQANRRNGFLVLWGIMSSPKSFPEGHHRAKCLLISTSSIFHSEPILSNSYFKGLFQLQESHFARVRPIRDAVACGPDSQLEHCCGFSKILWNTRRPLSPGDLLH